jgi:nucleotide-binding universal stress UspA family protein
MTYKTIVVHVDQSRHAAARIRLAAELAISEGAHLVGAAMTGISRFIYPDGAVFIDTVIADLRAAANRDLDQFDRIASSLGVVSYERRLTEDDAAGGLSLQSRYADLVVVSQTDPDARGDDASADVLEYVMLNSARPVLAVPYAGQFEHPGRRVLIAWDGSFEATRAIGNALPLLKRAHEVTVALFNVTDFSDTHGQQPGADMALYLARHGVKVNVTNATTELDIGNALLSQAADIGADLLVMGGYGHSRLREVLVGGVTRTILQCMTLPVLLSH